MILRKKAGDRPVWTVPMLVMLLALGTGTASAQVVAPSQDRRTQDLYETALRSLAEGRKNDASDQLARVIEDEPLHAGAWVDLALIQCGLGREEEAERLFAEVETRFNPSQEMLELIAQARETGCRQWKPMRTTSVSVGRGVDSNVNQGAADRELPLDTEFFPQRDDFTMASVEHMRELTPNGTVGFAQLQARHNDSLSQYDSSSLFVGLETPYRLNGWTMRASGLLGVVGLGGRMYQRHAQAQVRLAPPLPLPASLQLSLTGGLTHVQYVTLTNFDSTTAELRSQLTYRGDGLFASVNAGYQFDYAHASRPGGDRSGWLGGVLVRKALGRRVTGEAAYTRQGWQGAETYLPRVFETVRDQSTQVLRASLIYGLSKNWALRFDARAVRNSENIAVFKYNNRLLQLSLQWQGP
ncbi:tetratricopeptide repeat protein [Pseudoduganella sp. GCM10020061]|uniref:tetratricopeptide repeat protein n=1 Tax=Pseudoduganella sp. GCM10020061 TaxID=3317345 RepID=UPI003637B0B9